MYPFIEALTKLTVPQTLNRAVGQHMIPNWSYTFDVKKEGLLPQWSKDLGLGGLEQAVMQLKWLIGNETTDEMFKDTSYRHLDTIACGADVYAERNYELMDRVQQALDKYAANDVLMDTCEDLQDMFVNNGLMAKHLTLDGCLDAIGLPASKEELVAEPGYVGLQHGMAFGNANHYGTILFHIAGMLPENENDIREAVLNETFSYIPKQISMHFTPLPLTNSERMAYGSMAAHDDARDLRHLLETDALDETTVIKFGIDLEMIKDFTHEQIVSHYLDLQEFPKAHLHTNLHLTNLPPLSDYCSEILPYMLYSEVIASKMNMINTTFTINVDCVTMDKDEASLVERASKLITHPPAFMAFERADFNNLADQPLELEHLRLHNYVGA